MSEVVNGVVYLLTCLVSGKQYVGQTWDYERRMVDYRRGKGKGQRALHRAIAKYGWNNFTVVKIVQGIETQEWLNKIETAYIMAFNTLAPNGYNMTTGGEGGKRCAETRKKMSDVHRGEKNHMFGKTHLPETRKKISEAKRGEKHPMFGKTHSPETRKKLSESKRGEKNPMFGKPKSAEMRKKLSDAQRGKPKSAEMRAKMRASALLREARKRNAVKTATASLL